MDCFVVLRVAPAEFVGWVAAVRLVGLVVHLLLLPPFFFARAIGYAGHALPLVGLAARFDVR